MIEHIPVLLSEVLKFFEILKDKKEAIICDFTVGLGGHAEKILENLKNIKLIGFDRDKETLELARKRLLKFGNRVELYHKNFKDFDEIIDFKVDGALLDLGVSSYQLLLEERGFSFNSTAKLDMRMDQSQNFSAFDVVNKYSPVKLKEIFQKYGEIKNPERVVKAIIEARKKRKINTCKELSDIINTVLKRRGRLNPSTKFFQAIRIEVNKELENLEIFLSKIFDFLNVGGIIAIISFHSLEDRIVKLKMKRDDIKLLTKKPITPSKEEIAINPKSRSAKLRVGMKC